MSEYIFGIGWDLLQKGNIIAPIVFHPAKKNTPRILEIGEVLRWSRVRCPCWRRSVTVYSVAGLDPLGATRTYLHVWRHRYMGRVPATWNSAGTRALCLCDWAALFKIALLTLHGERPNKSGLKNCLFQSLLGTHILTGKTFYGDHPPFLLPVSTMVHTWNKSKPLNNLCYRCHQIRKAPWQCLS